MKKGMNLKVICYKRADFSAGKFYIGIWYLCCGGVSGRSGNSEAARKYSERLSWFSEVASEKFREKAVEAARALNGSHLLPQKTTLVASQFGTKFL